MVPRRGLGPWDQTCETGEEGSDMEERAEAERCEGTMNDGKGGDEGGGAR